MGKRIITQRRGRGTLTYRAPSHRYKGKITHRKYDDNEKKGVTKGKIVDLMHCPGHSAPLALIQYGKEKIVVAAPSNVRVGQEVESGVNAQIQIGNSTALKNIPEGTLIHNVEVSPGKSGFCRAAGSFAKVISKSEGKVLIRLPSKKQKLLNSECRATIGVVAGAGKRDKPFVKAGKRWHAMHAKGKLYPQTSGVAMNAVDHPFGSGRGRHIGKPRTPPRNAPPGRNVGLIRASRTGKK